MTPPGARAGRRQGDMRSFGPRPLLVQDLPRSPFGRVQGLVGGQTYTAKPLRRRSLAKRCSWAPLRSRSGAAPRAPLGRRSRVARPGESELGGVAALALVPGPNLYKCLQGATARVEHREPIEGMAPHDVCWSHLVIPSVEKRLKIAATTVAKNTVGRISVRDWAGQNFVAGVLRSDPRARDDRDCPRCGQKRPGRQRGARSEGAGFGQACRAFAALDVAAVDRRVRRRLAGKP